MRLIKYDGRGIKLPERDWKHLLVRFDASQASLSIYGYYYIHTPSLCRRYNYKCFLCPLGTVAGGTNRCTPLFDSIMGEELSQYVYMFDPVVAWQTQFDLEARQALGRIVAGLSAGERV